MRVHFFPEGEAAARAFARALNADCAPIQHHRFPDGESLVRVEAAGEIALLFRTLDHPDAKLVETLLASSALRDRGARRIILVAPYLSYMRQDKAFHAGEAVSQRVIGRLLAGAVDGLVTVDPHLHRVGSLAEVLPGIKSRALSAASVLSHLITADLAPGTILVGPDAESRPWVEAVAAPLNAPVLVGRKERHGDRDVELSIDGIAAVEGKPVILVDDVISSGATLIKSAALLRAAGAGSVEAVATHCLAGCSDLAALKAGGIARIRSTDTVPGPTNAASVADLLAGAVREILNQS